MFASSFSRRASLTASHVSVTRQRYASTLALKYSNALYSAALNQSPQQLTKVQSELANISSAISSSQELTAFISNPTLSLKERTAGLESLFAAAGKREPVSSLTKNFFAVLNENGRLGETGHAIDGFNDLVSKYKGELEVVVTSAQPLPSDVQRRLEASLKQSQAAQKAKTLKISNKVNPAVLGGLVVDFGDKTIDLSVSSRVNKLNSLLQDSV